MGVFPLSTQCSWDKLRIHRDPDQDKANNEDEWINEILQGVFNKLQETSQT